MGDLHSQIEYRVIFKYHRKGSKSMCMADWCLTQLARPKNGRLTSCPIREMSYVAKGQVRGCSELIKDDI